jgi:hypothetical protein
MRSAELVKPLGLRPDHVALMNAVDLADGRSRQQLGGALGLDSNGLIGDRRASAHWAAQAAPREERPTLSRPVPDPRRGSQDQEERHHRARERVRHRPRLPRRADHPIPRHPGPVRRRRRLPRQLAAPPGSTAHLARGRPPQSERLIPVDPDGCFPKGPSREPVSETSGARRSACQRSRPRGRVRGSRAG